METRPLRSQSPAPLPDAPYEWSSERVKEQVTILVLSNVLSAIALALGAAILAVLGLLAQWLLHYIVVPTNILTAIAFVGVGIVIVLLLLASWIAVMIHQNPLLIFGAITGAILGMAIVTSVQKGNWKDALKTATADAAKAQQSQSPKMPAPSASTASTTSTASGGPDGQQRTTADS